MTVVSFSLIYFFSSQIKLQLFDDWKMVKQHIDINREINWKSAIMESGSNLLTPGSYPGGDRQQFCVSWNSHQSNMHSAFPKLLSSEQFVDVTLACDGGSIKCHKVVLSACSDYLERLLLEIPCSHPIIFLRDMKMWELQALVEFMYRGEVYVEQQQLAKLMQAAEVLQVKS